MRHVLVLVVGALGLIACAGDQGAEPTLPTVDFTARLVVVVDADGLSAEPGADDGDIDLDAPSVPAGSVVEVRNADSRDHRITAGTTIDTGVLQPGDSTTVVMTTEGDVDFADTGAASRLVIKVTPRTEEP